MVGATGGRCKSARQACLALAKPNLSRQSSLKFLKENLMQSRIGPIVLVLLGILFLLNNLGLLPLRALVYHLGTWWPVILIAVGLAGIFGRRR